MYCDHFGFREKPFHITPNPRFIYLSKNHREVFAHLLYGIRNRSGFIEITGEVGTGKTTVLRTLLNQLEGEAYRLAFIFNPRLSAVDLLRTVNREFGIATAADTCADLLADLNAFLLRENASGKTVILVIDEAQNLEPAVLEQIRLLSNLETETDKLIQIVLSGQPELNDLLSQPGLRQLAQRITVRYQLKPLDFEDTRAYILHRLEIAGGSGRAIFTPAAVRRLFRHSGGVPRLLNVLGDRSLLIAYTRSDHHVGASTVDAAALELRREKRVQGRGLRPVLAALAATMILAAGLMISALGPQWVSRMAGTAGDAPVVAAPAPPAAAPLPVAPPPEPLREDRVTPETVDNLRRALVSRSPEGNAAEAFNAILRAWGEEPVRDEEGLPSGMEAAARRRGLLWTRFQGGTDSLLSLNTPALLELTFPGVPEKRYLSVLGVEKGRLRVLPAIAGETLSVRELESIWFGAGYVPWKNLYRIPWLSRPGEADPAVARLQEMLAAAGFPVAEPTKMYDLGTIRAVTAFQAARGIAPDGRVGPQTLMLLYQAVPQIDVPLLQHSAAGETP